MTHTPPSGPFALLTTPPRSRPPMRIAGSALFALQRAWPAAKSTTTPDAISPRYHALVVFMSPLLSCHPTLVRYDAALLQDEQQLAQVRDLVQGIGAHHDQVGELAGLDRAELIAHSQSSAACRVAARSACHGVAPSFTQSPSSSSAASFSGRMSEPRAIFTPAESA